MLPCCTQVTTPEFDPVQRAVTNKTLKLSTQRLAMLFQQNLSDATRMGPLDRLKEVFRTDKKLPILKVLHERIHRDSTNLFLKNDHFDLDETAQECPHAHFSFGEPLADRVACVKNLLQPGLQDLLTVKTDPVTNMETVCFNREEIYSLPLPHKLFSLWVNNKDFYCNWSVRVLDYAYNNIEAFMAFQKEGRPSDEKLITAAQVQQAKQLNSIMDADFYTAISHFSWAKNPDVEPVKNVFCKLSEQQSSELLSWSDNNKNALCDYFDELLQYEEISEEECYTKKRLIELRHCNLTTSLFSFLAFQTEKANAASNRGLTQNGRNLRERANTALTKRFNDSVRRSSNTSSTSLLTTQHRQTLRNRRATFRAPQVQQGEAATASSMNVNESDQLQEAKEGLRLMYDYLDEVTEVTNTSSIHAHPENDTGNILKQQLSKSLTLGAAGGNSQPKKRTNSWSGN